MTFDNAKYQHEWYMARKEQLSLKRKEMHRKQNLAREEMIRIGRGPKAVKVLYPESTLPDWFTMAEYRRRQNEFDEDASIWIDGVRQAKQDTLF